MSVGGAFTILIDFENRAYSWGSISDNSYSTQTTVPNLIGTLDGKPVFAGAVGDSFAFMLGLNLRAGEGVDSSNSGLIENYSHEGGYDSMYNYKRELPAPIFQRQSTFGSVQ